MIGDKTYYLSNQWPKRRETFKRASAASVRSSRSRLFRLRCRLLRRDKDVSKSILGTCLRYDFLFIAVFPMSRSTDSSSGIAPRILMTLLKSLLEPFYPVVYHETSMIKPMRELGELGRQQDWSDKIVWRFRNLG